jgi:antitoxin CptB
MTSPESTIEDIDTARKRLIFRSWHRGTKEMDLILGTFANKYAEKFSEEEIVQYTAILKISDPDLYGWFLGKEKPPANAMNPILEKLLKHTAV